MKRQDDLLQRLCGVPRLPQAVAVRIAQAARYYPEDRALERKMAAEDAAVLQFCRASVAPILSTARRLVAELERFRQANPGDSFPEYDQALSASRKLVTSIEGDRAVRRPRGRRPDLTAAHLREYIAFELIEAGIGASFAKEGVFHAVLTEVFGLEDAGKHVESFRKSLRDARAATVPPNSTRQRRN